jgi:hypothetical protein
VAPRTLALLVVSALAACVGDPPHVAAPTARREDAPAPILRHASAEPAASDAPAAAPPPTEVASAAPDTRPRLGSTRWYTWIWEQPTRGRDRTPIGGVRIGTSVPLKSRDPVPGAECGTGAWYAVEPFGYVCTDDTTTLDLDDPWFRSLASLAPGAGAYPYHYAFSMGAPLYGRVPTEAEQASCEATGFGPRATFASLGKWSEGHEVLVDRDPAHAIEPTDEVPAIFADHRAPPGTPWKLANPKVRVVPAGSGFSWVKSFRAAGRTWLVTPELFLVPADRVFPYRETHFRGVALGDGIDLPLAFVRGDRAPKLARTAAGAFEPTGEALEGKAVVALSGEEARVGKRRFVRAKEPADLWLELGADVTAVARAEKLHPAIGREDRWIEARLMSGTMVAYEGDRPVWATLWSGGLGGVPVKGNDPKRYATTELGVFEFQWKQRIATMSPDKGAPTVFFFADVPNIQYVHAPLALHVTYWHDRFGNLMSAECLNVSPEDGAWLFDFTLPKLPEGWNAVRGSKTTGPATRIHVKAD